MFRTSPSSIKSFTSLLLTIHTHPTGQRCKSQHLRLPNPVRSLFQCICRSLMYHFIVEQDSHISKKTKRQKELQISDARRHVALVVADRRRRKNRISPQNPSSIASARKLDTVTSSESVVGSAVSCPSSHSPSETCSYCRTIDGASSPESSEVTTPGPNLLLAQNNTDPFLTYPKQQLPKPIREVLHYAFTSLWPNMICDVRGKDLAQAQIEWRTLPLEQDLLWHVQVYLATNLAFALGRIPEDGPTRDKFSKYRLEHQTAAIQEVQKALDHVDPTAIGFQMLLMSIMVLGVSAEVDETPVPETHPRSPLATHQALHVYGKFLLMPHYKRALDHLVKLAGGCHNLHTMALSNFLLSSDLKHATRLGTALEYTSVRPYRSILQNGKHVPDTQAKQLAAVLGTGFSTCPYIKIELLEGIKKAVNSTIALDHYHRHENNWPSLDHVCIEANAAQRAFLNFDTKTIPLPPSMSHLLSVACRTACLIYSDMVLYPMPPVARVKARLASGLWEALEMLERQNSVEQRFYEEEKQCADVLLWIELMGVCASEHTPYRRLFVESLAKRVEEGVSSWYYFQTKMKTFLWWDFVCEEPAKRAWNEARQITGKGEYMATSIPETR